MALEDLRSQAQQRNPNELLEHMKSFKFEPKFSTGIWCLSPQTSRYHEVYRTEIGIERRLEVAAGMKQYGLAGLEAHYPSEINEDNVDTWSDFAGDTGIRIVSIAPDLSFEERFEWGSLSNPIPNRRREAIELTRQALELNQELDTEFATVRPLTDGYENPFGQDFAGARERFVEGLAEAMDAAPGVRVAFEPRQREPRGRMLFATAPEAMLLCGMVECLLQHGDNRKLLDEGHALCCLGLDFGNSIVAHEDPSSAFSWPLNEGRLAHVQFNSQQAGGFDQGLNAGVASPELLEALLYILKLHCYAGFCGININPERMPIETALINSMEALRSAADRINELDHESILNSHRYPELSRGWLEAHLIRMRAPYPERLVKLPRLPQFPPRR